MKNEKQKCSKIAKCEIDILFSTKSSWSDLDEIGFEKLMVNFLFLVTRMFFCICEVFINQVCAFIISSLSASMR